MYSTHATGYSTGSIQAVMSLVRRDYNLRISFFIFIMIKYKIMRSKVFLIILDIDISFDGRDPVPGAK